LDRSAPICIPASWPIETVVSLALTAEVAGCDTFWCLDCPPDGDAFVVQTVVAARTSRIGLGVAGVSARARHPVIAVGAALTLDEASGGRAVMLLLDGTEPAAAEVLKISHAALRRATFEGTHFALEHGAYRWGRSDLSVNGHSAELTVPRSPEHAQELLSRCSSG
jgi:hypothetical protein